MTLYQIDIPKRAGQRAEFDRITALNPGAPGDFLVETITPLSTHARHYRFEVDAEQGEFFLDQHMQVYEVTHEGIAPCDTMDAIRAHRPKDMMGHVRALLQNEGGNPLDEVLKQARVAVTWAEQEDRPHLEAFVSAQAISLTQRAHDICLPALQGSEYEIARAIKIREHVLSTLEAIADEWPAHQASINTLRTLWLTHTEAHLWDEMASFSKRTPLPKAFQPEGWPPLAHIEYMLELIQDAKDYHIESGEPFHPKDLARYIETFKIGRVELEQIFRVPHTLVRAWTRQKAGVYGLSPLITSVVRADLEQRRHPDLSMSKEVSMKGLELFRQAVKGARIREGCMPDLIYTQEHFVAESRQFAMLIYLDLIHTHGLDDVREHISDMWMSERGFLDYALVWCEETKISRHLALQLTLYAKEHLHRLLDVYER